MKNLFLTLALVFSGTLFCQETNVNVTLKGVEDSMWMFGLLTDNYYKGYNYQAADFTGEGLIREGKTIHFNITKPGAYCVTMKTSKFQKVTLVHIIVEEGEDYKIVQRVRNKQLYL